MSTDAGNPRSPIPAALGAAAARRLVAALMEPERADSEFPEVPGYVIDARLGGGGGGDVFRARRLGSDRPVALKIMSRSLTGGAAAQRAWRELDVLASLHLSAVPRVLDYGLFNGRLFIATEFVDGQTLDEHCEGLTRKEQVEVLACVAEAVQSLHEHGVIHRDLKPGNLMVDAHGDPVVIDMGLAAIVAGDPGLSITADGVPVGSPAFMAPEQARGDRGAVSVRSDVYGLGATAMVVLTGYAPHGLEWRGAEKAANAPLAEVLRRAAFDQSPSPAALDPSLPKSLASVLVKAMAFAPQERYPSAGELAADLRRWLRGEPVEASPPGIARRTLRWVARHPVLTTAGVCVAMLGCGDIDDTGRTVVPLR